LITGAASGIGKATCLHLARKGYHVVATTRRPDRAVGLQTAALSHNLPMDFVTLDVDHDSSVQAAVDEVLRRFERIDILVNCAGIATMGSIEESPIEVFKQVMETNFFGTLRCIRAVLPGMRRHKEGCIVNVSSLAGRVAMPSTSAYAASKSALEATTEVLAQEVCGLKIRVAIVEPSVVQTRIFQNALPGVQETQYPHRHRIDALFAALLRDRFPADAIARRIVDIIERSDPAGGVFRHPLGPSADSILAWRHSMSDEAWIQLVGGEEGDWVRAVRDRLQLDVSVFSAT